MSEKWLVAPMDGGEFYVGVKNGEPIECKVGDHHGDCVEVTLYPKAEDALARYHNVRRVRVLLDPEPVRAPESWGEVSDGD